VIEVRRQELKSEWFVGVNKEDRELEKRFNKKNFFFFNGVTRKKNVIFL
jgi:hypothetical protein